MDDLDNVAGSQVCRAAQLRVGSLRPEDVKRGDGKTRAGHIRIRERSIRTPMPLSIMMPVQAAGGSGTALTFPVSAARLALTSGAGSGFTARLIA